MSESSVSKQVVSASRFVDVLSVPPQQSAAWKTFSLHVINEAPRHMSAVFADHMLGVHISGKHRVRQVVGGRSVEGSSDPGAVTLIPGQVSFTCDASAPARFMVLCIPDVFLSRVIASHWNADTRNFEIIWQFRKRDPVVECLMGALAREAQLGSPSGQLYAESACEFLAHHIVRWYSSLSSPPPPSSGGLPAHRLKIVLEYIEENLGQPISLCCLAELAGVSARHFERAFRKAVGTPAHAYVLQKRVAAARHLLLTQAVLTVEQIAAQVGFSSASHLAYVFRRQTGYSPKLFRRLQSP